MDYRIEDVGKGSIGAIRPVWEELNRIHLRDSVNFKDHYRNFTFEKRIAAFAGVVDGDLKLSIVCERDRVVGYCLSTIAGSQGEIDSLCLLEEARGLGFGRKLVESHVGWMKGRSCGRITVSVSHGHDSVFGFYNELGFKERLVVLEYVGE
jgi:diamine N-acetyltransferase